MQEHREDIFLVKELKNDSEAAFSELFHKYAQWLHKVTYYRCGQNNEEAEDIVQEVFTALWEKRAQLKTEHPIHNFLFIVMRNIVAERYRHHLRVEKYLAEQKAQQDDSELPLPYKKELSDQLREAINKISAPSLRNVITKYYLDGKTQQEIIQETGMKVQTVRNFLQRGMKILKRNEENSTPRGIF